MWGCPDNQDVGLEAATIQRVRNSLLVEISRKGVCPCADNVRGLKPITEARDGHDFVVPMVGECSLGGEAARRKPAWSPGKYGCRYK